MATTTALAVNPVQARARRGPTALVGFLRAFARDRQALVGVVIIGMGLAGL